MSPIHLSPRLATDLSPSLAGVRRRLSTHLAIHVSPSLARQALRMFSCFPGIAYRGLLNRQDMSANVQ